MHLVLSCYRFLEDREIMHKNSLALFDVIENILFEIQDPEFQVISLMGCVYCASFENILYANGNRLC